MSIKQSGLLDLLKEGTTHLTGLEAAVIRNIEACKKLSTVVRTSLGPNGKKKMVINHLGKLFVTSDAGTIIKELEVVHPAAKMLVLASEMQDSECGDATNLVVVLGGELLTQAEPLVRMGLHPSDIVQGYKKAGQRALQLLDEMAVESVTNLRDASEVARKCLRSIIASKQYGHEEWLAPLVAKACVAVVEPLDDPSKFSVDNVRTVKIPGGGVKDSSLVKGFVLNRGVEGDVRSVKGAKVAVFASGIDASKTETKGVVRMTKADQLLEFSNTEEKYIEKIVNEILDSGVNVLVSGGPIGEMAMHYIEKRGIMVVKVNSKFDIRRLCGAVGATPLVRLGKPTAEEIGHCETVSVREIGSTNVVVFEQYGKSSSQVSTIIIRGATMNILDDIERAIDDGVRGYKTLTRDARLVPGAGASEMRMAKELRTLGEAQAALEQYAILKFSEALEIIPRMLLENSGADSIHSIANLSAEHQKGNSNFGVNIENGQVCDVTKELQIFDLLLAKKWAVQLAVDAAVTILRIDQLIVSKAAGGPKAPQMGPMDADD